MVVCELDVPSQRNASLKVAQLKWIRGQQISFNHPKHKRKKRWCGNLKIESWTKVVINERDVDVLKYVLVCVLVCRLTNAYSHTLVSWIEFVIESRSDLFIIMITTWQWNLLTKYDLNTTY